MSPGPSPAAPHEDQPEIITRNARYGLVLFVVTLILNIIALQVVRRYREQYD